MTTRSLTILAAASLATLAAMTALAADAAYLDPAASRFRVEGREDAFRVAGDLTIHGVTRPISLDARVARGDGGVLVATGETEIKQTDFGIEPFSVALGAIAVADELGVAFELRAKP
jgi:polyisoprenoid-binding protein YceI